MRLFRWLRWIWRLALLTLLVAIIAWLAQDSGSLEIRWRGWQLQTTALMGMGFVVAVAILTVLMDRLRRWLVGWPARRRDRRHTRRLEKGLNALSEGMLAMASGDTRQAQKLAGKASRFVKKEPLAMLLSAQSAEMGGDSATAQTLYHRMLDLPETRVPALRALLQQVAKNPDPTVGLAVARQAFALEPTINWVQEGLLVWLGLNHHWDEADQILQKMITDRHLTRAEGQRWRAVVLLQQAQQLPSTQQDARERLVAQAYRLAPSYRPVAIAYLGQLTAQAAQSGSRSGQSESRQTKTLLHKWWAIQPCKELLDLHEQLAPSEPFAHLRAAEALAAKKPLHPLSYLAVAQAALACKLWGKARQQLQAIVDLEPLPDAFRLMAALEKSEHGSKEAAYKWMDKASKTAEPAAWVCASCHHQASEWTAICSSCHAVASLDLAGGEIDGGKDLEDEALASLPAVL